MSTRKTLVRAMVVVALVGLGMRLEQVRAQPKGALADVEFWHFGFVVHDVEKSIKAWDAVLQAGHTPVVERKGFSFPPSTTYDPNTVVQTADIILNGAEIHLLQPSGGSSPWRDHLDKHGETLDHVAFRAKDVDSAIEGLLAQGGTLAMGGIDSPGSTYIAMPDLPFMIELNRMN